MSLLPEELEQYRDEAKRNLASIHEIQFAGPTYQVLVQDRSTDRDYWVFLQLNDQGGLHDAFCSCGEIEEEVEDDEEEKEISRCWHIAAAYLAVFDNKQEPLHQRFEKSLWNKLCRLYADNLGDDPQCIISPKPGLYESRSTTGKLLFSLKTKTDDVEGIIEGMFFHRPKETEETSLKFSNLPHEEILRWRQGRAGLQLKYELSFWSDLAKWLMKLQEEGKYYQVVFQFSNHQLPNWIEISFEDLELGFYISEANLTQIIPFLNTIDSPLKVYETGQQGISKAVYDRKEGVLIIEGKKKSDSKAKTKQFSGKGIPIGSWIFVQDKGFFAEESHQLLKTPRLEGEELSNALTEHGQFLAPYLVDAAIHTDKVTLFYQNYFDESWNLHIVAYLFEPGDLTQGDSRLIGRWAYLEDDGFYPIEGGRFKEAETIIPLFQVSEFVNQNRAWLNMQEGFHTHIRSLEYQLGYSVTPERRLVFARSLNEAKEKSKLQDFGAWVYLEGSGFFSKAASTFGFLLKPGVSISPEQVPLFIKINKDELALVPGFFTSTCPVTKVGLRVELTKDHTIQVTPEYELLPQTDAKSMMFFDDFIYLEGQGFHELPSRLLLPEKFRHPIELKGDDLALFINYELEELQKYIVSIDPHIKKPKKCMLITNVVQEEKEKGRGWYRFALSYQTENGVVSAVKLWDSLKKKENFGFYEQGLMVLKDERFDWLQSLPHHRIDKEKGTILLSTLEFMRLNAYDPISIVGEDSKSKEYFEELVKLQPAIEPDIGGLVSHLRPYQEIGVRWLWFLYQQRLSGLLCDEMGLGKTHQAMGLMASIHNLYRRFAEGQQKHFLVVCPTSVIYHWMDKIHDFLPGLRVYPFYGTKRNLEEFPENYDILVTSYGILRNEQETLSKIPFELAVFDEVQIAKNQSSRVYAALTSLNAEIKLGLTGTPIENYLRELKSLFDIVLPSYMPGETEFRQFFIKPIEKEGKKSRKELLNRLIHPFLLRRRKMDVLTDLPEKTEETAYCDLLAFQHQLYMEVLEQRRKPLIDELQSSGHAIPYMHIFALLSSLKQICDHPAVFYKKPHEYQNFASGKWELFLELLQEARESGQKVVVFSQYLNMLDIIQAYLKEQKIGFATIRGSTQDRKEQIRLFNQEPTCEVFVGSLQAAGLGIDLTAGSVVIHYDRWWNAARENQATDRVHRIGQSRGVQVFKLVTKDTFEEKIDEMIRRKGKLMEDVVGADDHTVLKTFSREDLIELLSVIEKGEDHPSISDVE